MRPASRVRACACGTLACSGNAGHETENARQDLARGNKDRDVGLTRERQKRCCDNRNAPGTLAVDAPRGRGAAGASARAPREPGLGGGQQCPCGPGAPRRPWAGRPGHSSHRGSWSGLWGAAPGPAVVDESARTAACSWMRSRDSAPSECGSRTLPTRVHTVIRAIHIHIKQTGERGKSQREASRGAEQGRGGRTTARPSKAPTVPLENTDTLPGRKEPRNA